MFTLPDLLQELSDLIVRSRRNSKTFMAVVQLVCNLLAEEDTRERLNCSHSSDAQ